MLTAISFYGLKHLNIVPTVMVHAWFSWSCSIPWFLYCSIVWKFQFVDLLKSTDEQTPSTTRASTATTLTTGMTTSRISDEDEATATINCMSYY